MSFDAPDCDGRTDVELINIYEFYDKAYFGQVWCGIVHAFKPEWGMAWMAVESREWCSKGDHYAGLVKGRCGRCRRPMEVGQ